MNKPQRFDMATVLQASDIVNFETQTASSSPTHLSTKLTSLQPVYHHPKVGTISTNHFFTPYIVVSDIRWNLSHDIELHNCDSPDKVNINFVLNGRIDTKFSGINHELNMRPRHHNIVFAPEGKDVSYIGRNEKMNMFHVSLDKNYFITSIGTDDPWSAHMINGIDRLMPISAAKQNRESTPRMMQLIDSIRNCEVQGPMKSLLIQSRLLELLAFQVDQFRTPLPVHDEICQDEAEKLHQLKTYLDANFLSELSLAQLSRHCVLNEFKVKKGFKLLFGTTVFNYLRKLRMEYAGNLLRNCSFSIEEVADILGYEHPQHFSIAFKKFVGVSPREFRVG